MVTAYKVFYVNPKTKALHSLCQSPRVAPEFRAFKRRYDRTKWNYAKKEDIAKGYGLLIFDGFNAACEGKAYLYDFNLHIFLVEVDKMYVPDSNKLLVNYFGIKMLTLSGTWPFGTRMCNKLRVISMEY